MTTAYYTLHGIKDIITGIFKLLDIITKLLLFSNSFTSLVKLKTIRKKNKRAMMALSRSQETTAYQCWNVNIFY
jgi:hypothetical protein